MYFEEFPNFLYDFDVNGKRKAILMTDITRNVRFRRDILSNITVYDEYDIIDGETPEIIAEKFYGDAQYHWVVMLANNRFDYINDFPLDYPRLLAYMENKYGDSLDDVRYYVNANGKIVHQTSVGAAPVSNREYEERLNESKRRIKIISRDLLATVLNNYKEFM
jgi:hypothetical protein